MAELEWDINPAFTSEQHFGASKPLKLRRIKGSMRRKSRKSFTMSHWKWRKVDLPFLQLYQILLLKQVDASNSYSRLGRSINALSLCHIQLERNNSTLHVHATIDQSESLQIHESW